MNVHQVHVIMKLDALITSMIMNAFVSLDTSTKTAQQVRSNYLCPKLDKGFSSFVNICKSIESSEEVILQK